ncbi:MAG: tetratricopeptide repeat protein, partial [Alphaproteobacteria bacterium]|nr:tetratricopeptide repeat protein [Alphaproteobacteria bacterium]
MALLQAAIKAVIHKLIGDEALDELAPALGDWLADWLDSPIRQATEQLERRYKDRGIDPAQLDRLLDDAEARVKKHGLPWRSLTDDRLDPAIIAGRILDRDPPRSEDRALLTEMLSALYGSILSHHKAIQQANHAFRMKVLSQQAAILERLEAGPRQRSSLAAACAAAVLRPPERERPAPEQIAALLRAEADLVPLTGREHILGEILDWCVGDPHAASVRLFTGAGGTGKTRLFREVCRALPAEWTAGFLDVDHPVPETVWRALTETRPVLVVVDYADYHEGKPALETLLRFAEMTPAGAKPLRIALVTRGGGDWWTRFRRENVCAALDETEPVPPFQSPDDRITLFKKARAAFAQATGKPEPDTEPDLTAPHFGRPLFLLIQALLHVLGDTDSGGGRRGLLHRILARERQQIAKTLGDPDRMRAAVQLAALVTLAGGAADRRAAEAMAATTPLLRGLPAITINTILDMLRYRYPGEGGTPIWLAGVTPDLLGETLVAQEIENNAALLPTFAGFADPEQWTTGLRTLLHVVRDDAGFVSHLGALLEDHTPKVLAAIAANEQGTAGEALGHILAKALATLDPTLAQRLLDHIPLETVALREIAWEATRLGLERTRNSGLGDETVAAWLNDLGVRLSDLGRREEALEATREAVETLRRLAEPRPDAVLPALATALNNLGRVLSDLGRREEALEATREAVEIR